MKMVVTPAKKRDGDALSANEISFFVNGTVNNTIGREQIGAKLMAIYIRGMDNAETVALTRAMMSSGDVLLWPQFPGIMVDKHSTGGCGAGCAISVWRLLLPGHDG